MYFRRESLTLDNVSVYLYNTFQYAYTEFGATTKIVYLYFSLADVPNIAHHILNTPAHFNLPLKGIAVGNGCWGGDATSVVCNGPNEDADDVELYFGKGLVSRKLHTQIMDKCKFESGKR